MKALIACGGTGGHFYPGLALGKELKTRGWEVLFLLKKDDAARKTLDSLSLAWTEIDAAALSRTLNPFKFALFGFKLAASMAASLRVLRDWKPDVVAGTGGYTSFPVIAGARLLGLPTALHESNAQLGLANAAASLFVNTLAAGLPLKDRRPSDYVLTGTPIRTDFAMPAVPAEARKHFGLREDLFTVLIFGGSQGARVLNRAMVNATLQLAAKTRIQFLHITGKRDFSEIIGRYGALPDNVRIIEYCDAMNLAFLACDLAVCRSGASTAAELIQLKKPAVLVPFPFAAANHQEANALVLENAGAAVLIKESEKLAQHLAQEIAILYSDGNTLAAMKAAYAKLGVPEPLKAAVLLANIIERLGNQRQLHTA